MIVTVVGLLIIASVPLTGGRLSGLAHIEFNHSWLVMLALALQIAITVAFVDADATVLAVLHIGSYLLAVAFLWLNRRISGLVVLGTGGLANFAAIAANGGVMPASPAALELAGISGDVGFQNSRAVDGARLPLLGDVFAIPEGWPLANVFSIGDIVLVVGLTILVHRAGRRPVPDVDAGTPLA